MKQIYRDNLFTNANRYRVSFMDISVSAVGDVLNEFVSVCRSCCLRNDTEEKKYVMLQVSCTMNRVRMIECVLFFASKFYMHVYMNGNREGRGEGAGGARPTWFLLILFPCSGNMKSDLKQRHGIKHSKEQIPIG